MVVVRIVVTTFPMQLPFISMIVPCLLADPSRKATMNQAFGERAMVNLFFNMAAAGLGNGTVNHADCC